MNSNLVISLPADTALTAHSLVRLTTAGTVELAAAASGAIIGTCLQDVANNGMADIALTKGHAVHYVRAGGVIALGALVKGDASATGKVITHGGSGTALGNALEASTADGDIIRVILAPIAPSAATSAS